MGLHILYLQLCWLYVPLFPVTLFLMLLPATLCSSHLSATPVGLYFSSFFKVQVLFIYLFICWFVCL